MEVGVTFAEDRLCNPIGETDPEGVADYEATKSDRVAP